MIKKLIIEQKDSHHYNEVLFDKINEIIDKVNEIDKRTSHLIKCINPYDLNDVARNTKPRKP